MYIIHVPNIVQNKLSCKKQRKQRRKLQTIWIEQEIKIRRFYNGA